MHWASAGTSRTTGHRTSPRRSTTNYARRNPSASLSGRPAGHPGRVSTTTRRVQSGSRPSCLPNRRTGRRAPIDRPHRTVAMTLWATLKKVADHWASRGLERPFIGYLPSAGGSGIATGEEFVPEASYFGVRMVEMSLREGGKFFNSFLPLGIVLTEFSFGNDRQRRPTILNNDEIATQLKAAGATPGYIEFKNIYAVRRAPVKHDNLSLFVGLFRLPYHDIAQQVLQLAAELTAETGLSPGVPEGLRVAEKVYDRIAGLFGLTSVTPLFSYADGSALGQSGYLLVAGSALDNATASRLSVTDNRLLLDGRRVSDLDYCLLAIEHTATLLPDRSDSINPLTQLGFHRRWQEVALSTAKRNFELAEQQMLNLRADVIMSPELTENDRLIAIGA